MTTTSLRTDEGVAKSANACIDACWCPMSHPSCKLYCTASSDWSDKRSSSESMLGKYTLTCRSAVTSFTENKIEAALLPLCSLPESERERQSGDTSMTAGVIEEQLTDPLYSAVLPEE